MLKNGLSEIGDSETVERAAAFVTKAGGAVAELPPVAAVLARAAEARGERSASRSPLTVVLPLGGLLLATVAGTFAWRNRDRVLQVAGDALAGVKGAIGRLTAGNGGDAEAADAWSAPTAEQSDPWPAPTAEQSDPWPALVGSPA